MKKLNRRRKTQHKGDFGRLLIVAGSKGLTGAAYLTSMAALRSGAGLVTLAVPEKIYTVLARRHAEVMVRPFSSTAKGSFAFKAAQKILQFSKAQDVLAIGPGLSQAPETRKFVKKILTRSIVPLVVDADGINALKGSLSTLKSCAYRAVLTPHPKEFIRVFGGKLSKDSQERKKRASDVAKKYKVVILLKGHKTVVADPSGKTYVNQTGNPGMATGGTGDVLTGMIAAFIGQGMSLFDAARLGAHLHGLAGDLGARKVGEVSLIAGDLIDFLPQAVKKCAR